MAGTLIAPVGTGSDRDFLPGSDRVVYAIPASGRRPSRIVVEAVYQSIKPAHAAATSAQNTRESKQLAALFPRFADPVTIARLELSAPR